MIDYILKDRKKPKSYLLKVFGIEVFSSSYSNRFGWFRIFGVGLVFKDVLIHPLLFSERNGYKKYLKLGKWIISYLSKSIN